MTLLRRMVYMGFGALLALALVIGGVAVFAQSDDDGDTPAVQDDGDDEAQDEGEDTDADDQEEDSEDDRLIPDRRFWGFRGGRSWGGDEAELLADALGISVEELEAAREEVRAAAIEQALEEGLITEEQAEALLEDEGAFGFRRGFRALDIDKDERLADALDITVEELQEARSEVRAARLKAMVDAGVLTQEQADLIEAQHAVQGYVDQEALAATIQDAYEAAIEAALDADVITEEQADKLQENLPTFGPFGFGGRGHHRRGLPVGPGGAFVPGADAPAVESAFDA